MKIGERWTQLKYELRIMIEFLILKGYFRNANHAIWFFTTVYFFVLNVFYYFFSKLEYLWLFPVLFLHTTPIIKSIVYLKRGVVSEIYSKDCIWFNSVMVILYLILRIVK